MEIIESNLKPVAESDLPVLIDFWSPNCPACKLMMPTVDEAAKKYKGRMEIAKAEAAKNARLIEMTGINALPTFLIIKDKAEVDRLVGRVSHRAFNEFIERHAQ